MYSAAELFRTWVVQFYKYEIYRLKITYFIYTKKSTSHSRTPNRFRCVLVLLLLAIWYRVPIKLKVPVETPNIDTTTISKVELQRRIINYIDNRTHNGGRIPRYPIQQRLQPTGCTFTMRIQISQDCSLGVSGPQEPSPDQPFSFLRADDLDLWVLCEVLVELVFHVWHVGEVVHEDDLFDEVIGGTVQN